MVLSSLLTKTKKIKFLYNKSPIKTMYTFPCNLKKIYIFIIFLEQYYSKKIVFWFKNSYFFLGASVSQWLSQMKVIFLSALVCPSDALPLFLPSHSTCPPIPHTLPYSWTPYFLPSPIHALPATPPAFLFFCPSNPPVLTVLLSPHSSSPSTPPALPLLLPSHCSCPPTPPALPLLLPLYFFFTFVPSLYGRAWEGIRNRRAGGVRGQEEWEGRRA